VAQVVQPDGWEAGLLDEAVEAFGDGVGVPWAAVGSGVTARTGRWTSTPSSATGPCMSCSIKATACWNVPAVSAGR
jgi:hypothetical protein